MKERSKRPFKGGCFWGEGGMEENIGGGMLPRSELNFDCTKQEGNLCVIGCSMSVQSLIAESLFDSQPPTPKTDTLHPKIKSGRTKLF
jgi:hypothetical protein